MFLFHNINWEWKKFENRKRERDRKREKREVCIIGLSQEIGCISRSGWCCGLEESVFIKEKINDRREKRLKW
ncbi:Protein CBG27722 [Caenorhabditis briggsae]|uniref:Protein CBG27722 n=1 Tax=Caenorhabditis briggsae TaxID=6238 RepID=B6IJ20_CAEBR|nr:Protein CBG27722 [Caenorhabditis briggsae]CAS00000.1 Protein CBG27722 [Caenorhabditis briggsae]